MLFQRRHDIQSNDIQHNDIQHNDIQSNGIQDSDIQHKGVICDTQHNSTRSVSSAIMLIGVMLNVTIYLLFC